MDFPTLNRLRRSQLGSRRHRNLRLVLGLVAALVAGASADASTWSGVVGWNDENHAEAFVVYRRACAASSSRPQAVGSRYGLPDGAWRRVCDAALAVPESLDAESAREFFERRFSPASEGEAHFTAYFEPEYPAARAPDARHRHAIHRPPADAESRSLSRAAIAEGALDGRGLEIAWLRSEADVLFLHIQGSGRLRFADGSAMCVGFAGRNGRPYTPIGRPLVESGALSASEVSMQSIRAELERMSERESAALIRLNASYIFLGERHPCDAESHPSGAMGVPLSPGRSVAIDPAHHDYGALMWIDVAAGNGDPPMRRLVLAQDAGAAIRGPLRADVFLGRGLQAADVAGRMNRGGGLRVLLPR